MAATVVHDRLWSTMACRKDSHPHHRTTRSRKDPHLSRTRALSSMDRRKDSGRLTRRLSPQDSRRRTVPPSRLLFPRRKDPRNDGTPKTGLRRLRETHLGLLRGRRSGGHIRRQQWQQTGPTEPRRKVRQGWDPRHLARQARPLEWRGGHRSHVAETICDNKEIIETNIRSVKISSPDYRGWDPDKAVDDYYGRIRDREQAYETITEKIWPFIRIFNSRIVFFLMNIHNRFRTIYFARSGQSLIEHSYKADSDLSPAGWEYAERLKEFVTERRTKSLEQRGYNPSDRRLVVRPLFSVVRYPTERHSKIWTSTRRRAHHTAWPFETAKSSMSALSLDSNLSAIAPDPSKEGASKLRVKVIEKTQMSEINPGVWDGLTPDQAKKFYPEEWARFVKDPYAFRAPRAESYHDLSVRLEPVLIELEREKEDLLIIGHSSVIRCLLAYLIGLPASEIPAIEIARGDLLEVVPTSYGVHSQAFHFWDGPGRRVVTPDGEDYLSHRDETNFYENWAEDTKGKKRMTTLDIASLSNGGEGFDLVH
ncbi:bifunctional 6-phosphofructo-2-kinase/fructose-2,6-bisphosphate 2-phosphatase [Lanmaoa asiatica]|nr:bifunctional 6-phosphofructo-2-kinase/fructose-2,6-bisphosphate 2-phosphatase [Lanmaoa asiatica]